MIKFNCPPPKKKSKSEQYYNDSLHRLPHHSEQMGNVTWQNYFFKQEAQKLHRKACYVTVTGDKCFYHVLYFSTLLNVFYFLLQHFLHLWITGRQDVGNTLTAA